VTFDVAIDLEAFDNTIQGWFKNATGLQTIWRRQSAPMPPYPFAALMRTVGPTPKAPQWELRTSTNLSRPQGQEIQMDVGVPCSIVVSCQVYVCMTDARNPNVNAAVYAARAQSTLSLPSVLAVLRAAGISIVRPGEVQNIDELIEDAYVSRANLDVTFGATLSLTEFATYIERVHAESETFGIDQEFGGTP
jgi:hypothetical protein